jgi:hypothetical protein
VATCNRKGNTAVDDTFNHGFAVNLCRQQGFTGPPRRMGQDPTCQLTITRGASILCAATTSRLQSEHNHRTTHGTLRIESSPSFIHTCDKLQDTLLQFRVVLPTTSTHGIHGANPQSIISSAHLERVASEIHVIIAVEHDVFRQWDSQAVLYKQCHVVG